VVHRDRIVTAVFAAALTLILGWNIYRAAVEPKEGTAPARAVIVSDTPQNATVPSVWSVQPGAPTESANP